MISPTRPVRFSPSMTTLLSRCCAASALVAAAVMTHAGCASDDARQSSRGPRQTLTLDSFIASPGAVNGDGAGNGNTVEAANAGEPANPAAETPPSDEAIEVAQGNTPPPLPPPGRVQPITPGNEVILDSLVGQINGRPVFADAFFAPIDAKLRLAAEQTTLMQFRETLQREVAEHLRDILESELILAQAQARLTEQQQQGLFAFLAQRQEEFVLETGGGSAEEARRRLLEDQGITMEDFMEEQRQRALIQLILQQEIAPRIVISWKDIEREYAARYAEYNPSGTARITRIWFDNAQFSEQIEQVRSRLEAGDPFMEVWEAQQAMHRADNTYQVPTGGLGEITDLVSAFREQLAPLTVGQTSEAFLYEMPGGPRTVWLHVAEMNQPPARSIYDEAVQLEIRRLLYNQRFAEERLRYMQEQLGEDVMQDITRMTARLVEVGEKRYLR